MRRARWLERVLLLGFDEQEIADIVDDLHELAQDKGPLARRVYYWVELSKYPLRRRIDAVRHRGVGEDLGRGRGGAMETWAKDTRYALRALVRNPGFSLMAIAIITVSMGAATAIVSVVEGVLLRPLPIQEPDRVVSLWLEGDDGRRRRMTPGNYVDIVQLEGVFSRVAAFGAQTASLTVADEPVFLRGSRVTPGYFETLGVEPLLGRGFTEDEGEMGGPAVVVLGHHVWTQTFGSDPAVTRRSIRLDGADFQVVGVAPPGVYPTQATVSGEIPFTASNQDFFVPMRLTSEMWASRRPHVLGMIGRLTRGVTSEAARAPLAALSARLQETEPLNRGERVLMTSFTEEVVGDVRFALLTLLGTVGLVLLIAVVNVGALFVLRAEDRRGELAIRAAMGAPRGRLVRQMLLESTLIAGLASLAAIGVARGALGLMRSLVPYQIPRLDEVGVDGTTLLATVAGGVAVAIAFGLAPASRLGHGSLAGHASRGRTTATSGRRRVQAAVVGVQASLCVVVLVGAALLTRSYAALRAVDPGFGSPDTWAMSIPAPLADLEEVAQRVRALPGVAAAAVAYDHPLERSWGDTFLLEGLERTDADPPTVASLRPFGVDYFVAAGIDVVEGRVPDRVDFGGDVAYAVVNETFAEVFFPGRTPVGAGVIVPTAQRWLGTNGRFEIAGVVRDVRFLGPDQPSGPALYLPLSHFAVDATILLVRPDGPDTGVLAGVRAVVRDIDPTLGVQRAQRLGDILDGLLARPRFNMMLLVALASIGLLLCGLGAYGLMGRIVATRVREIGIEMALGADRLRLARGVVGSALRPLVVGGALGLVVALGLGRVIRSLLFGVGPTDVVSFVASAAFVLLVGLLAALVPTGRAISIDPASALRAE